MKKYVVTGGAGFIGSALVRSLLNLGDGSVQVMDNLSTGHKENLDAVASRVTFHELDICDFDASAAVIRGADTVFHMAAIPSVPRSIVDPRPSHRSNIDGTLNVLRACVDGKVRKVVYAAALIKTSRTSIAGGKVFNAGNGNRSSLNQVWQVLQKIEGVDIPTLYGPPRPGDVRNSQADTTAAVTYLGHSPRFVLEDGLRRTLEWYCNHPRSASA